jgi:hypothetical protein
MSKRRHATREAPTEKASTPDPSEPDDIEQPSRKKPKGGEEGIGARNADENNIVVEATKVISFMSIFAASTRKIRKAGTNPRSPLG